MNRFIKVFFWVLLLAPLLTGCSSTRFTSSIKNQDFKLAEEVKFNIERVSIDLGDNLWAGQPLRTDLTRGLLMEGAEKAYPEYFVTEGIAIPLELKISIKTKGSSNLITTLMSLVSLGILPATSSVKDDVKVEVKVRGKRNASLLIESSEFRQEKHAWATILSPIGRIPVLGKSDIPKIAGGLASPKAGIARTQLLRRSIVNSIVKNFKNSDMRKLLASYKRSKRLAEVKKRLGERLLTGKSSQADKAAARQPLVLMPLRANGVAAANRPAMESALVSGLSRRYKVFSGKRVADKVREIYSKVTAKAEAGKECDDTMCMQDIGKSFKSELVASANVIKNASGYLLTLNIANVFDDVLVMSESEPCKGCDEYQVIERLKTISSRY